MDDQQNEVRVEEAKSKEVADVQKRAALQKSSSMEPPRMNAVDGKGDSSPKKTAAPADPNGECQWRKQQSQQNKTGNSGSWTRKPHNDRRKSTDFSRQMSQEKKPNKARCPSENQKNSEGVHPNNAANERRQAWNRSNSNAKTASRSSKARSMSTTQSQEEPVSGDENSNKKRNRSSTNSNGHRYGSNSMNSNGESFDYDDMELDEPFSDSDDESPRQPRKPCLVIPRGRIRTLSGTVPPVGNSPKWGGPTMCLSCLQFFDLPEQIQGFAGHLLEEHHIVVVEMDLIVDPKRYTEYWRQRFAKESVDKIFPKIVPDSESTFFGKTVFYYEMSERIPEDYLLRQRLAMRRLEEALSCQQREREESSFGMQCIFCRYVARGNRSKIIHHLYMIHHLNLGSPDNLVFVAEYIDHLKEKLQRNECIYCEKIFSDRAVLMDHMRKRNHREVNPKNNYYDRFYIINYLELGKRWLDVLAEDFEDTMPTFQDSDDEEEEVSWHEWQEDNDDTDMLRVVCLFCDHSEEKVENLLKHINENHSFDLLNYIEKEKLGLYDRMKLLNFLRKQTFNTPNFHARCDNSPKPAVIPDRSEWSAEEQLIPMFGNDHLLHLLESFLEEKHGDGTEKKDEQVDGEDNGEIPSDPMLKALVEESKLNTVEGVLAEDWPDLSQSVLTTDQELCKSFR